MRMTKALSILVASIMIFSAAGAAGIPASDTAKEHSQGPANSPVIDENWDLERVDFIHYAKPGGAGGGGSGSCYKLMGVKWTTTPVSYVINPTNPEGLSDEFVTSAIAASAETWDAATSKELFNDAYTVDTSAQYGVQNYVNAIAFGDYADSGVIGVTTVWYTRIGKRIVEFDMLLNTDFAWGDATVDPALMDLQNILVHELGHSVGLADIYTTTCSTVTMYGYSTEGETSKRTIEQPDITGLQAMYGA
jgi:hypothetical protein